MNASNQGKDRAARCSRWFLLLLALCFSLTGALAQATSTGTVAGQVTDAQGSAIPLAEITITDIATGNTQKAVTNETGRYNFANVTPGVYNLSVSKTGFKQAKLENEKVTVGIVLTVNVTMEVGAVSETAVITATSGTELQTTNATVGATLTGRQLELLTNLGRDANALMVLQPAVAPGGQVAGAVQDQNTYQLDGGNNTSDMDGAQTVYTQSAGFIGSAAAGGTPSGVLPTPAESIEEFKVGTTNQTADFNGSAGGQIQLVTKRGTNQFHGAVYEHYLGSNFGANSWLNNHTPVRNTAGQITSPFTPLPSTHQNRFGASLGGPLTPRILGGKTYFFGLYEGRRFPQSTSFERLVPSELLRAGIVQVPDSTGVYKPYNLNPTAVTIKGVTYAPATCGATNVPCDPRGLGLNPIVSQIWNKYMPLPNDPTAGDNYNTQGYLATLRIPQNGDTYVARIDHDFGSKWRWMSSYRYFDFNQLTNVQTDFGGALGGTLGQYQSVAPRVQKPGYFVTGLTTTVTANMTNDFHYNYLRNFWQWGTAAAPPQLPGLGGAVEIGGESRNALIPYNINTQDTRQRFWDGIDHSFRDDVTWLKGNHLYSFGGMYQRNWNYHQRNDNGQGIMAANVYQIANIGQTFTVGGVNYMPTTVPSAQATTWQSFYTQVLGIVGQPQTLYTRKLPDLSLQALGTPAEDKAIIPTYNVYFSDIWRMKPSLTLTYGLGYTVEMPPYELEGKQVLLVDAAGKPIKTEEYLAKRQEAALAGQVYNPTLGFVTVGNAQGKPKYPYDPYYGGISPRLAVAWSPKFKSGGLMSKVLGEDRSVVRAGYSRIYGRLNGVNLVLVPLLGTGLMQAVSCQGAVRASAAVNGNQCLGASGGANPLTSFRIGTDGNVAPVPAAAPTISQPYYPGVGGNAQAADGTVVDPSYKPNYSDSFDLTIQRELIPRKLIMEVGYIGRRIGNEFQQINLDAVPHMLTLGGQKFSTAFANLYTQLCGLGATCANNALSTIQAQPWFEAAMGGANSAYCTGFANCTAAVASKQAANISNTRVYDLWSSLSGQSAWTLGRTMPSSIPTQLTGIYMEMSNGWGNYNAGFFSLEARDWHGLTVRSNLTFSKTLGTGAVTQSTSSFTVLDPWDIHAMYGPQSFDVRFLYNLSSLYEVPFFKSQKGIAGRLLGGWTLAPLFTARSGFPLRVSMTQGAGTNCQSFGEVNCASGNTWENAVLTSAYSAGNSAYKNSNLTGSIGLNTNASRGGSGINMFQNPDAVYAQFRRIILGIDHTGGGNGVLRGLPTWNMDLSVAKDFKFTERIGMTFLAQFANVFNKFQPSDPAMNLNSPQTFGYINGQANSPRQIEFGLRVHF